MIQRIKDTLAKYGAWMLLGVLSAVLVILAIRHEDSPWFEKLSDYIRKKERHIEAIEDLQRMKLKTDRDIIERYSESIREINENYARQKQELSEQEKRDVAQLAMEAEASPAIVAKRAAEKYGWRYVQ